MKKEKTLSKLIAELDTVFALYVKLRDCDSSGIVTCFVTGERLWYLDCDAAHFVPRAQMSTRFMEMNVHATSRETNRYDPDHINKYAEKMALKYGHMAVDQLEKDAKSLQKFTRSDLNDMIEEYTFRVKELKKLKGL